MLYSSLFPDIAIPDIAMAMSAANPWVGADLEVYETDAWITLYLSLPGIRPEAIDTQILPDRVILSLEQTIEQVSLLGTSLGAAVVQRTVPLPVRIDPAQATVMIEGRALVVTIPKLAADRLQPLDIEPLRRRWIGAKHWLGQKLKGVADYLLSD